MIRLNVFIRVKASERTEVIDKVSQLAKISVAELGCVAYDLYASISRADVLMICETWDSEEDLKRHHETAHFTEISPWLHEHCEVKIEKFNF